MIKIKIDKNKLNEPVFKLWFKELNEKEERFLKRALIESKEIQGSYKYEIPIKFLLPIINNIGKENIKIDYSFSSSLHNYFCINGIISNRPSYSLCRGLYKGKCRTKSANSRTLGPKSASIS